MFYTDLTFPEYEERFSSEEACIDAIFQVRWPRGFICPSCGHNDGYRLRERPVVECCVCGCQKSITGDTIFHRTRTPLTIWFSIIYEMSHDKGGGSAMKLAKRFGMHHDTVWNIMSKIHMAMGARDGNLTLAGHIEFDEAFFGGLTRRETGKTATEDKIQVLILVESEGGSAGNLVMQVIDSGLFEPIETVVERKIESESGGQWLRSDGKGNHHIVMSHGHRINMQPIRPKRLLNDLLGWASKAISLAKRFFMGTYHHYCKIHIQRYLDEFCYRWNRRHQEKQLATHLIAACALHPAVNCSDLVSWVA